MGAPTPTEQSLLDAIADMARENPTRVIYTITKGLEASGIRSLVAVVGTGDFPQVSTTLNIDDVTNEVIKQVTAALLNRAGLPPDAVSMFSNVAGGAATRWLQQQRQRAALRGQPVGQPRAAENTQSTGGAAGEQPQGAGGDGSGMHWRQKWGK